MPTFRLPAGCRHILSAAIALAGLTPAASEAQDCRNVFEAGVAGAVTRFAGATDLSGAPGVVLRFGYWLPLNFSVEGEASFAQADAKNAAAQIDVRTLSGSVLYNIPAGLTNSFYMRAGLGSTRYGSAGTCQDAPSGTICGQPTTLMVGAGGRLSLTSLMMLRGEAMYNHNRANSITRPDESISFGNVTASVGLSFMLGSRPLPDTDRDGIPNNRDRCADTASGAQVDSQGCALDDDGDGVSNGVDRCPNTPVGAKPDAAGCPTDSDKDNILDGLDRCPDTRPGVLVDPQGCPRDSDQDGIPDGLDRCSATPVGATVDVLGCPGDEDSDGVLDGLDECPRSPAGAVVDAQGCAQGQVRRRPEPEPEPDSVPAPPPAPRPTPAPKPAPGPSASIGTEPAVVSNVSFFAGTARLRQASYGPLDSIAQILLADSTLVVEIGAHSDARASSDETKRLTTLQAEAVRTFLVQKGVPAGQIVARGYGADRPLTPDTTPRGLARNRRIEIRRLPSAP